MIKSTTQIITVKWICNNNISLKVKKYHEIKKIKKVYEIKINE